MSERISERVGQGASGDEQTLRPQVLAVDDRPENQTDGYVGMVVFLGSWAMMFAALFFAYGTLRTRAGAWPPPGWDPLPLLLPGINTVIALASSVTMSRAVADLRKNRLIAFRHWMLMTLALGVVFVALQVTVWTALWQDGLTLQSGIYGGVFYLLTCFHFIHVAVGLGLLLWLVLPALRRDPTAPRRVPVLLTSMFWHFVTAVWVVIFLSVYVA